MFETIMGESPYHSPTDMGVNMVGNCIVDDEVVCAAARQEIIRRYYDALCERRRGRCGDEPVYKLELLMKKAEVDVSLRKVVTTAQDKARRTERPATAIELPGGRLIRGKTSELMNPAAGVLLNALKVLSDIPKKTHLISPDAIKPIQKIKVKHLGAVNPRLNAEEVLIALAISATENPTAAQALARLADLRGCQAHSTVILPHEDMEIYKKLGLQVTCEPQYETGNLYQH